MTKVEISRAAAAPDPVDPGPIGGSVAAEIAERRDDDRAYAAEFDRLAPYEAIARIAIFRRGELGLSQADVARRMKTTASVVSRIESGRHATTARTLRRLFEALDGYLIVGAEFSSAQSKPRRELVVLGEELRVTDADQA
jgi:ribosome-binding protein aMBF1 (putative translation factor)